MVFHRIVASSLMIAAAGGVFASDVVSPRAALFVEQPGRLEFSGQMIVKPLAPAQLVQGGMTPQRASQRYAAAVARLAADVIKIYPEVGELVVAVPPGQTENTYAAQLSATGDYVYVVPNWVCYPMLTPNDPQFGNQWHHQAIQSELAWNISTGSPSVTCAFVDTGIDLTHPDLAPSLVPGFNSVNDLAQLDGGDVSDVNGHGTAVAGTAAAVGNNGQGVAGVGWNLKIMPIRTSNSSGGGANLDDILQGARWAIENGARVASASYTGVQSPPVETTGEYIKSIGGLFCYAADNFNQNHSSFDWPNVIVVGATAPGDVKADFSSFGVAVDVFAPGVDIWTTFNGGGYGPTGGTSFATPMTNGVLGMIWSLDENLTNDQVEAILFYSCDDIGAPGEDDTFGFGRINLFNALQLVGAGSNPIANDDFADGFLGASFTLDVMANDLDIDLDPLSITAFDAVSTLGGSVVLSIGTGPEGRDELIYTPAVGGIDTFTYTIAELGGASDTATVTVEVIDPNSFREPDGALFPASGVQVSYYALTNPTQLPNFDTLTPFKTEIVANINYASTGGVFAGSGLSENVGAVFVGLVDAPQTGLYNFYINSDDGSRLFVGDTLLVDNDGLHGMVEKSGEIGLKTGLHLIRVDFFERGGGAGLIVSYDGPNLSKQVIPPASWFYESCLGDIVSDGTIDQTDLNVVLATYGLCAGDPGYIGLADLNGDNCVEQLDLNLLLSAFNESCP